MQTVGVIWPHHLFKSIWINIYAMIKMAILDWMQLLMKKKFFACINLELHCDETRGATIPGLQPIRSTAGSNMGCDIK